MAPDDSPDDIYDRKELWTDGMKRWEERSEEWDEVFDKAKTLMYSVIDMRWTSGGFRLHDPIQ